MFGRKAKKIEQLESDLAYEKELSQKYWSWYSEAGSRAKNKYGPLIEQRDTINKSLAEENRDLVRQLELYKAVLAQLSIPVKLPVRKPNG